MRRVPGRSSKRAVARGLRTPAAFAGGKRFAGAVLAGGESRRMGRDKAKLRLRGETLVRRQVRVLREAGAEPVVVVCRAEQRISVRGVERSCDEFVGAGPLAGVHAALKAAAAAGARWIAVLAVDMPAIEPAWFAELLRTCRDGVGAVARHADGFEPLAAIYPTNALATAERRLRRGERSMQRFVAALIRQRRMRVLKLREEERWRVANWNRPEDRKPRVVRVSDPRRWSPVSRRACWPRRV